MHGTVRKWGNSAAIRLPTSILEAVQLQIDQPVDVHEEDGRIIIQPIRHKNLSLESLTAAITDENRHGEVDFGVAIGGEAW
ncbi:transcriptional regulator AbrB [Neokomagataea thailandica NBRC 106555]|uniref:AbrB/MazE/SpoVT family DNA-binding domain-containing protein n=2 Tax=Neokomagataea TaxID=1223423 RepID=A0A4Y6VBR0_9PROT|nr:MULTISPECIES: AbrB/MazE/SpoVT family DNA-binding domain-containing protein [Neokomagataea]QDH26090.1 AbrB/MazE/SpoVT family DNA-binding domain-containing protein [Neokomagataea tanensis]GBR52177.1 transcriptional regulator AbrB [Neokomagataea thailandica NBRC 106555]